MSADDACAQGWALKQACYDAWHRDPAAARTAAAGLAALAAAHPGDAELAALAAWTAGIGALTEGRLDDALGALQTAQGSFEAAGDIAHAAETRVPQIVALAMLGRSDDARACAEAARAQFVASGDERSAGKVELNLGTLLFRQDRHVEAEPYLRHAALRFARVGDAELSILADGALANVLTWQLRFDEALQMYERARLRAQARDLPVLLAQMHQGIGHLELHRGHWPRALRELATAAALAAQSGGSPQRRIEAEAALADAYLTVNLLAEAVAVCDGLIPQAAALPAPTEHAWAELQRARALARLGDAAGARAGFDAAQRLYAAAGNRAVLGLVALGRGRLELEGRDAAAAQASADAALQTLDGSGLAAWALEAELLRAAALAAGGAAEAARDAFERVRARAAGPPALPQIGWQALAGLGELARAAGDLAAARSAFEQALDAVEQLRAALPADDLRRALGVETERAHDGLVAVARTEGDAARLMIDLERGRGRALAIALAGRRCDAAAGADAAAAAQPEAAPAEADDAARLRWTRQQWQQAVLDDDADRAPALAARVQALEQALLEGHRRSRLRGAASGAPADALPPFDATALAALRAALGGDRALLAYHLLGDRLLAVVVTADGVRQADWPAPALAAQVGALRFQIETLRAGSALATRHGAQLLARARARLQALHDMVWAPAAPLLGGRHRVVVLPHRALHYLPFAALHDGHDWLVRTHEIALAPGAAAWLALQRRPPGRFERALVLGVGGPGLTQVAAEAAAVGAAFGDRARVLLDDAATQAALAAHAAGADVLHLACHGRFRADNPAFSFVQLGDGPLTLHDVAQMRLPAALVALSACETGAGRIGAGDEVVGLVRAFLLAGADRVLATQWPVDDQAIAVLAARFYAGLAEGLAPARALQRAQAEAAQAGAHPFHWAAFALHGRG